MANRGPQRNVDRSVEYPVELELGRGPEGGLRLADLLLTYEANPSDKQSAVAHKMRRSSSDDEPSV
jgi:hypothetical protein